VTSATADSAPVVVAPFPAALSVSRRAISVVRTTHADRLADHLVYRLNMLFSARFASLCAAVPMQDGVIAALPMSDHGLRNVALTGTYEPEVTHFANTVIRPGDTVVDVGAHLGLHSLTFAERVGRDGHVHSFEPSPRLNQLLKAGAELSGFTSRISVHAAAVGASSGQINLYLDDGLGWTNSTNPEWRTGTAPLEVAVVTLDAALLSKLDRPPALLKIDVEGAEMAVLEGARQLLDRLPPRAVIVELSTAADATQILSLLYEHGYSASGDTTVPKYTGARVGDTGFEYSNAYLIRSS
jgi:FkbM family methyltransferase